MQTILERIDSHAHFAWPVSFDSLTDLLQKTGASSACLAALPGTSRLDPTPEILCYKFRHPDTVFAFGCLDATVYETAPSHCGRHFVRRARLLLRAGCDGIKLLEGKPTMRRKYPVPDFDSAAWDPFWSFAERNSIPILWHVNDPEEFWDPDALPAYAKQSGWGYTAQDVNNEAQYRQVWNVLNRHPNLNLTLPHLFFLSAQLSRLADWFERFPRLHVDLAPGIELYRNLSKTPEQTRRFFLAYADRIQYGTDIGGRAALNGSVTQIDEQESLRRVEIIRHFLYGSGNEKIIADGKYLIGSEPFELRGMRFSDELRQKLEHDNFLAFVGHTAPRRVRLSMVQRLNRKLKRALILRHKRTGVPADLRAVECTDAFIRNSRSHKI